MKSSILSSFMIEAGLITFKYYFNFCNSKNKK